MGHQSFSEKSQTRQVLQLVFDHLDAGSGVTLTQDNGILTITATGGGGTVTSVGMSVPSFLSVSGSPVTTSGTLAVTYSGTALPIANGGSGQTTANAALNAFLPSQATHAGKHLQTDGTNTSWVAPATGTVTSVGVTGNNGIGVSGSPITSSGSITLSLGAITPTSVSTGALTASGAISLPSGSITRANLVNGTACTVIGRSANSTGAVADISMGTNDRLLGRVANVVGSTQLTAGMVPSALITSAMLRNSAARSVIGRSANSSGVPADIASTGARTFLADNSAGTSIAFRAIDAGDFPTGNWIGAINGSTLCTTTALVSNTNAWEAVTGTISLPAAGTYRITAVVNAQIVPAIITASVTISARLYNITDAAVVANSRASVLSGYTTGVIWRGSATLDAVVTVAGAKTIRIEGVRDTSSGSTYTLSSITSDGFADTTLSYVRIA